MTVLRGTAEGIDDSRTAIGFESAACRPRLGDIDADGPGVAAGAGWFDGRTGRHQGYSMRLESGGRDRRVELGVVTKPRGDSPGGGWCG